MKPASMAGTRAAPVTGTPGTRTRTAAPAAACLLAAGLLLAACGGGGGSGGGGTQPGALPPFTDDALARVRHLTGSEAPGETAIQNDARRRAQDRTGWRGRYVTAGGPADAAGARALEARAVAFSGAHADVSLRNPVLSRSGITVHGARAPGTDGGRFAGMRSVGATMGHAGLAVLTAPGPGGGIYVRTDTAPAPAGPPEPPRAGDAASATWTGVMLGADVRRTRDLLQGDARVEYRFADGKVDVRLTGIVSLEAAAEGRQDTARGDVTFTDIPAGGDGIWRTPDGPRYVEVGLTGPGHAEAAGLFRTPDMAGAFGARRD